ncbi:hypothetical protein F7725_000225, partial [Dissostichus mawsoni]
MSISKKEPNGLGGDCLLSAGGNGWFWPTTRLSLVTSTSCSKGICCFTRNDETCNQGFVSRRCRTTTSKTSTAPTVPQQRSQRLVAYCMDSYDKLKPYGNAINGCIDGFSRYIMWMEAYTTNSDQSGCVPTQVPKMGMSGKCSGSCVESIRIIMPEKGALFTDAVRPISRYNRGCENMEHTPNKIEACPWVAGRKPHSHVLYATALRSSRGQTQCILPEEVAVCKEECTPKGQYPCDETVFKLCVLLMGVNGWSSPVDAYSAVELYSLLRNEILETIEIACIIM